MPVKAYGATFLEESVCSMLGQTSPDWRLLVIIEDRDRVEIETVLAAHLGDRRIALIVNEGRKLSGAFNTGMRRAETAFVATLFGDDLWAPTAVEVLGRSIDTSPSTDFFHSSRRIIDENGRPISSILRSRKTVSVDDFLRYSPVKHLLCWRRELGLAIGGMDESLDSVGVDDFDFPWTMAERGATFTAIEDCLYLYRDHREFFRLTTHLPLNHHKREIARIIDKHGGGEAAVASAVASAEQSFLRQCLYRSRLDRWLKRLQGHDPRNGWRESFR